MRHCTRPQLVITLRWRCARADQATLMKQSRYWNPEEHQRFLDVLQEYGPYDVRAIASYVSTRNAT